MRSSAAALAVVVVIQIAFPALAEIQDVEVGGSLRIRGNWYSAADLDFDNDAPDTFFVEQRTRVNVSAEFTDNVHAFIELDSYDLYGDGFRALTGAEGIYSVPGRGIGFPDASALTGFDESADGTDVNFYQGYIEISEALGTGFNIRIGRSETVLGDEFLVGNNDSSSNFRGLSFDGIWLSYAHGNFDLHWFWTRLVTNNNPNRLESSGDIDFAGSRNSYTGWKDMTLSWFTNFYRQALVDGTEVLGFEETTTFSTIGLNFTGNRSRFDWSANGAYQFGSSGMEDIDISAFAGQAVVGYTFDVNLQPRVFANGAYYSGADEEVFTDGDGDLGFNRLFSDHEYSEFIDSTDLSNFWMLGGGAGAQVTETIGLTGVVTWFQTVEDYGTDENDLGIEVAIYAKYDYSDDLYFQAGYAHFFAGQALEDGAVVTDSGLSTIGGFGESDDLDYVYLETGISF